MMNIFKSKLFLIFVGVLSLLLIVPPLIPIDKYRPKLEAAVNSRIKGKIKLGALKLNFRGAFRLGFELLEVFDREGRVVTTLKEGHVSFPWIGLLTLSPRLVIVAESPQLQVLKLKDKSLNLVDVFPTEGDGTSSEETKTDGAEPAAEKGGVSAGVGAWIASRSSLGFDVEKASIRYEDLVTKSVQSVQDLSIKSERFSLKDPSSLQVRGLLKSRDGGVGYRVEGPFAFEMSVNPVWAGSQFKQAKIELGFEGSDLTISVPGSFKKKAGDKFGLTTELLWTGQEVRVTDGEFEFLMFKTAFKGIGTLVDFSLERFEGEAHVPSTDLKSLSDSIDALAVYNLEGFLKLDTSFSWSQAETAYKGVLTVEKGALSGGGLPKRITFKSKTEFATDRLDDFSFIGEADKSDFNLSGSVSRFAAPKFNIRFQSNSLDLDSLLPPPPTTKNAALNSSDPHRPLERSVAQAGAGNLSVDAMCAEMMKNPLVANAEGLLQANLKSIRTNGLLLENFVMRASYANKTLRVLEATSRLLKGSMSATSAITFGTVKPSLIYSLALDKISLKDATESQLALFRNTMAGELSFKVSGSGTSLNSDQMVNTLESKGSFTVRDGTIKSVDIAAMLQEAVSKSIEKISSAYPKLKGKSIRVRDDLKSEYSSISSSFTMSKGNVSIPDFEAKAVINRGVDLKGRVDMNLISRDFKAEWLVSDTYNLTKAKDISVEIQGVEVPEVLAEKGQPVIFPISLACKIEKPCPSYLKLPEHFAKIALKNVGGSSKKILVEKVKEAAGGDLKEAGKKLFKGLFR